MQADPLAVLPVIVERQHPAAPFGPRRTSHRANQALDMLGHTAFRSERLRSSVVPRGSRIERHQRLSVCRRRVIHHDATLATTRWRIGGAHRRLGRRSAHPAPTLLPYRLDSHAQPSPTPTAVITRPTATRRRSRLRRPSRPQRPRRNRPQAHARTDILACGVAARSTGHSQGQTSVYPTVVNADQVRSRGTTGRGVTVPILDLGAPRPRSWWPHSSRRQLRRDERVTRDPAVTARMSRGSLPVMARDHRRDVRGIAPEANHRRPRARQPGSWVGFVCRARERVGHIAPRRLQHPRDEFSLARRSRCLPHQTRYRAAVEIAWQAASWSSLRRENRTAARHGRLAGIRSVRDHGRCHGRSWDGDQRRRRARVLLGVGHPRTRTPS